MTKSGKLLLKGLVTVMLVLGLLYTVYTHFFLHNETVAKGQNQAAYDFTLPDLEGKERSLSDFKGKGVVVNIWATYCPPCEKEMPYLDNVYQEYKEKGIEILAVNAKEPRILVGPFVEEKNLSFPILLDRTGTTVDKYQVLNLPTTFFIDEDGVIVEKVSGELTEEKIRSLVEKIIPQ